MRQVQEATDALGAARVLGTFFAVDTHPPAEPPPGWATLADLVARPGVLRDRVEATRRLLAVPAVAPADVHLRTAASLSGLGLTARVLSPVLGAALLTGLLPVAGPGGWLFGPPVHGPLPTAARPVGVVRCPAPDEVAEALVEHYLLPVIAPLLEALRGTYALSGKVLQGNVTAALAGAARMCMHARPDLAEPAAATVEALLRHGPLADTGAWVRPDPARRRWFLVRRSCCLLLRLPGAAPCGDCVLLPPAVRREQWAAELRG